MTRLAHVRTPLIPDLAPRSADLILNGLDLLVDSLDLLYRLLDTGRVAPLALPTDDTIVDLLAPSEFSIDLLASSAFVGGLDGLFDEFHAARLADAVLSVAVALEVAPFPVAACKARHLEEAHVV